MVERLVKCAGMILIALLMSAQAIAVELGDFSHGRAVVTFREIGKSVVIDKQGNVVVVPEKLSAKGRVTIGDFRSGVAKVSIKVSIFDYEYGFIDADGKWVIKPGAFEETRWFSETDGVVAAKKNGKYGFIDKSGAWVIEPRFDEALDFVNGYAQAGIDVENGGKKERLWGLIDRKGEWVIRPQMKDDVLHPEHIDGEAIFVLDGTAKKWGLLELKTERWLIRPRYDSLYDGFSEGLASVCGEDYTRACWYIDRTGKQVIPSGYPHYSAALSFHNGVAAVADHNQFDRWGLIDKSGNWIVKPMFYDIMWAGEGLWIGRTGKYGDPNKTYIYLDNAGKKAVDVVLKSAGSFSDGLARVEDSTGKGYMTKDGVWGISPETLKKNLARWYKEEADAIKAHEQEEKDRVAKFRKSLKEGGDTNCGPVIEARRSMVKVYFPVKDYGNEHWVRKEQIFPPDYGCRFVNGQYQVPDLKTE